MSLTPAILDPVLAGGLPVTAHHAPPLEDIAGSGDTGKKHPGIGSCKSLCFSEPQFPSKAESGGLFCPSGRPEFCMYMCNTLTVTKYCLKGGRIASLVQAPTVCPVWPSVPMLERSWQMHGCVWSGFLGLGQEQSIVWGEMNPCSRGSCPSWWVDGALAILAGPAGLALESSHDGNPIFLTQARVSRVTPPRLELPTAQACPGLSRLQPSPCQACGKTQECGGQEVFSPADLLTLSFRRPEPPGPCDLAALVQRSPWGSPRPLLPILQHGVLKDSQTHPWPGPVLAGSFQASVVGTGGSEGRVHACCPEQSTAERHIAGPP